MFDGVPVAIVAALAKDRVIGAGCRMPWHIPTDLQHFRALTLGKPLIMGRRTFAAIGRVLPGRATIVLSRSRCAGDAGGVVYASSLSDALAAALRSARLTGAGEIMVAGGGQIFDALLPVTDHLNLTEVDLRVAGNVRFPVIEDGDWQETARVVPPRAPEDEAAISFVDMRRRRLDTPL